jgi:hypothetical protein
LYKRIGIELLQSFRRTVALWTLISHFNKNLEKRNTTLTWFQFGELRNCAIGSNSIEYSKLLENNREKFYVVLVE